MATAQQLLDVAKAQLGVRIPTPGVPFATDFSCAIYTMWCYGEVGIHDYDDDSPGHQMGIFQRQGRFDAVPEVGCQIFIDLTGANLDFASHTGFVVAVNDDNTVTTIENNALDSAGINRVAYHTRNRPGDGFTLGFGHPAYDTARPPSPTPAPRPVEPDSYTGRIIVELPMLQQGDNGQYVSNMQGLLVANGSGIDIDGDFGPMTNAALVEFQGAVGIDADGICGPVTWRHLLSV